MPRPVWTVKRLRGQSYQLRGAMYGCVDQWNDKWLSKSMSLLDPRE